MKSKFLVSRSTLWLSAFLAAATLAPSTTLPPARAQAAQLTESPVAAISLPAGAKRLAERSMPANVSQQLQHLIGTLGDKVARGENEVFAWPANGRTVARLKEVKAQLKERLKAAGWTYEETAPLGEAGGSIPIFCVHAGEPRKGLIGLLTPTPTQIVLSWTEVLPGNTGGAPTEEAETDTTAETETAGGYGEPEPETETGNDADADVGTGNAPREDGWETPPPKQRPGKAPAKGGTTASTATALPAGSTVLELAGTDKLINVMKGVALKIPAFPKIAPKKGLVRGFVKNSQGKPLAGALIGVRSSAIGGAYSGASGKTDANGYYEIQVPWGACEFYCAGYPTNWGESRAALGLHPANGEAGQFASANGYVQNWVLLTYGVGSREALVDQPQYINAYYGGTISISYFVADPRFGGYDKALPAGAKIRLILSPKGPLFDGSKGRTFVIYQTVTDNLVPGFKIMNLPLGEYTLKAALISNNKTATLKMREAGPYAYKAFGLSPKQTPGAGTITFRPLDATANNVAPAHGHWDELSVLIEPQG